MSNLHLQILEALNPHAESCCCPERDDCRCCGADGMQDAAAIVRVVLELHKPNPVNDRPPYCDQCVGGYEGVKEWPCPTVRAIAEKLGIEASGV